ncbi:MAG: hypothetical protein ACK53Y_15800 [bacterium]
MDGSTHDKSTKLQYTPEKILRGTKRTRTVHELQGRKSCEHKVDERDIGQQTSLFRRLGGQLRRPGAY